MGKPGQAIAKTSEPYEAPDGSTWHLVLEWAETGGRGECVGISLQSMDLPKRPVTSAVWRSVPVASIIDRKRTELIATYAAHGSGSTTRR